MAAWVFPQSAADFYRAQQRRAVLAVAAARRSWSRMGDDFDGSWESVGPRVQVIAEAAQLGAARDGAEYVVTSLRDLDIDPSPAPEGDVNPRALVGVAPDGRPLDSLLRGAVVDAKTAVAAGATPQEALARGGRWLDRVVHTLVGDAGRVSSGVGIASRRQVFGYIRMLNPPSCSRCAVLAGKWYGWNSGFARHPNCDCVHVPNNDSAWEARKGDPAADVDAYFRSLTATEQDRHFTKAGAEAIRDGADIGRVVNVRRSMSYAGETRTAVNAQGRVVNERHRTALTNRPAAGRLTPETIYRRADGDRDLAIELLRRNGYLT